MILSVAIKEIVAPSTNKMSSFFFKYAYRNEGVDFNDQVLCSANENKF